MKTNILVTGAGGAPANNFIKSLRLSRDKFNVIGVDANKYNLALSEANTKYLLPKQYTAAQFINIVNSITKKHKIDLIHPQPEKDVLLISKYKSKIKTRTFLPKLKTILEAQNKMTTIKKIKNNGITVPQSYLISNENDIKKAINILKKSHNKFWLRAIHGAGSKAALPFTEFNHAKFWLDYWIKNKNLGYGEFMISEFLPGKDFAFQSIWYNGELIVSQARQRLEYVFAKLTVSGQTSSPSCAITINRDDVNQIATKSILALDKHATGVFCVDLKENANNIPCPTEVNAGRFFTTSNFFSEAGCNMPYYYVKLAKNEKLPPLKKYNNLKPNLFWIRNMDMNYKLIKNNKFNILENYAK